MVREAYFMEILRRKAAIRRELRGDSDGIIVEWRGGRVN